MKMNTEMRRFLCGDGAHLQGCCTIADLGTSETHLVPLICASIVKKVEEPSKIPSPTRPQAFACCHDVTQDEGTTSLVFGQEMGICGVA